MAAISLAVQPSACLNESIFSLLDSSWYAHSILNYPIAAASGPSVESTGALKTIVESEEVLRRSATIVDEAEMRRVFDRFDRNGDGLICGEELRRYMSCCGNDLSDAEVHSMLSCVDLNEDGGVDFEEFLSLYQTRCSDDDTEGDDHNEDEEEALLGAFRVFDKNHDGFISAEELQTVLLNLGMPEGKSLISCKEMIRCVDRNGDGQCDIREFIEMMSTKCF